jgi:hypothetical protein
MYRSLVVGLAALSLAMPAMAQDNDTFTVPVLSDFENDTYQPFFEDLAERLIGRLGKGALTVEADHEPGSGRIAGYDLDSDGLVVVSVDVTARAVEAGPSSSTYGGGVVLNRDGNTFYGLFTVGADYHFIAWVDGDITQRLSGSITGQSADEPVNLELHQAEGGGVEVFVNGESRGSVSDSRVDGTNAGLAVFGTGTYTFDNFRFTTLDD